MALNAALIHGIGKLCIGYNSKHYSNLTLSAQKECEELDGKDESRDCGSSLPMSCDIIRSLQIRTTRMQRSYQIQRAEFTANFAL
jgi:hypothetical protein